MKQLLSVIPSPSTSLRTGSADASCGTIFGYLRGILRFRFASLGMTKSIRIFVVTIVFVVAASVIASGEKIDVSQIVDPTTAESVLDAKVKIATPRNVQGADGYYSKCNYYSATPGKALLLRVYQSAWQYDLQKELDAVTKNTPALKEVSGLGDKAMVTDWKASALPARALMLYVVKGNVLITVGVSGFEDENVSLGKIKGVAEKILAQL